MISTKSFLKEFDFTPPGSTSYFTKDYSLVVLFSYAELTSNVIK